MPLTALVGNAEARAALLRALARGRLPHALLLHGPRGVGKRAAAQALAQALLCPDAAPDACGRCSACRRVDDGIHPDYRAIERDGQFVKIEAAREVVRESYLRPYEGRAKVFVFPEAEGLHEESANTLLKTLEEPPASTYLVLVTASREAVLPTIRSRCQGVRFHALERSDLVRLLVEKHGLDAAEADVRARLASGSEALAVALDLEAARAQRETALGLLLPLARGRMGPAEATGLVETADRLAKKDGAAEAFLLGTLRAVARDSLVLAAGGSADLLVTPEALPRLEPLARALGAAGAAALLGDLEQAEEDLRLNANRKLLVEAVLAGVFERAASAAAR